MPQISGESLISQSQHVVFQQLIVAWRLHRYALERGSADLMNSEFILGGKGAGALMSPDWASVRASQNASSSNDAGPSAASKAPESKTVSAKADDGIYSARARNRGPDVASLDNFSFKDFVDIVNPLQHIPVLNLVYREATGDKISSFAQVAGGAIYGGMVGLVSGIANAIFQDETGKDMGGTVLAALTGDEARKASQPIPSEMTPAGDTGAIMLANAAPTEPVAAAPLQAAAAGGLSDADADKILSAYAQATQQTASTPPATRQLANAGDILNKAPLHQSAATAVADADTSGETSPDAAPVTTEVPSGALPKQANADGAKFYSLANVQRTGKGQAPKMPLYDMPDVRLKPITRSHAVGAPAPAAPATEIVPLASKAEAQKILGLNPPAPAPVANSSKGLSPKLEQMMLDGINKYQQGIESGTFRPLPKVDIEG